MAQNVVVPPFDTAPEIVVGGTPQSVFAFEFPFWQAADVLVYVDGEALDPDAYTVEGFLIQNGSPVEGGYGSGEVTLNTPVANVTVTLDRFVVGDRETQFGRSAPLPMPTLNSDLNKLTARQQDIRRRQLQIEDDFAAVVTEAAAEAAAEVAQNVADDADRAEAAESGAVAAETEAEGWAGAAAASAGSAATERDGADAAKIDAQEAAAQAAADLLAIQQIASGAPDAPSILNKAFKDGSNVEAPEFRDALGLGDAAVKDTGTATGTLAAGDDGRILGAAQKGQNLADLTDKDEARVTLDAAQNVGTVVAKGFTFDDGAAGAANSALLQAAMNQIPSGGYGRVEIAVPAGTEAADLHFADATRPDQGTRRITLVAPVGITFKDASPVVSRVISGLVEGTAKPEYDFVTNQSPIDPASLGRPEYLPGAGGAITHRQTSVIFPDADGYVATRHDVRVASSFSQNAGGFNEVHQVDDVKATDNGTYWARWVLMVTPLGHDSGLPDAPTDPQGGGFVVGEWNPQNRMRDPGNVTEAIDSAPLVLGLSMVPETQDFTGLQGENWGFDVTASFYLAPSAFPASSGAHAKSKNGFLCDPNGIAPDGRLITANGNSGSGPGGGDASVDPYAILWANYRWKVGFDLAEATFADGNRALKLGVGHVITARTTGGNDRNLLGSASDITLLYAITDASGVRVMSPNGGRTALFVDTSNTSSDSFIAARAGVAKATVAAASDTAANVDLELAPKGTGDVIIPVASLSNAANDAAAASAGVPLGGLYRNGSVLMVRVA